MHNMAMADETNTPLEVPEDEYAGVDAVIDQYIAGLQDTKKDPAKRRQFAEEWAASKRKKQEQEQQNQPDNPFADAEVTRAPNEQHEHTETDDESPPKRRPVIPKGDPESISDEEYKEEDTPTTKEAATKLVEEMLSGLEDVAVDDAKRLLLILKDNKIKSMKYVLQTFFKRIYITDGKAARALNTLLKETATTPRLRVIVLKTYFNDIKQSTIDDIFAEDEEDDDDDVVSKKKKHAEIDDANEIYEVPMPGPDGKPVLDKTGSIIYIKVTARDLRQIMLSQKGGMGGSSDPIEWVQMMTNASDKNAAVIRDFQNKELQRWQAMANRDQFKEMDEWKQRLVTMGVVTAGSERPSEYQKQVIDSARAAGKEVFNETKGEIKPIFEMFRDDIVAPLRERVLANKEGVLPDGNKPKNIPGGIKNIDGLEEKMAALQSAALEQMEAEAKITAEAKSKAGKT